MLLLIFLTAANRWTPFSHFRSRVRRFQSHVHILLGLLSMEVAREGNLMSVCGPVLQAVVELRRHSAESCHQRDDARHVECSSHF